LTSHGCRDVGGIRQHLVVDLIPCGVANLERFVEAVRGDGDAVVVELDVDITGALIGDDHLEGVVLFRTAVLAHVHPVDAIAGARVRVIERAECHGTIGVTSVDIGEERKDVWARCCLKINSVIRGERSTTIVEDKPAVVVDVDGGVGRSEPVDVESQVDGSDAAIVAGTHRRGVAVDVAGNSPVESDDLVPLHVLDVGISFEFLDILLGELGGEAIDGTAQFLIRATTDFLGLVLDRVDVSTVANDNDVVVSRAFVA